MNEIRCPVCGTSMSLSPARSRRSKKPKTFLMLKCTEDGRHFRGFINDETFVSEVMQQAGLAVSEALDRSAGTGSEGGWGARSSHKKGTE